MSGGITPVKLLLFGFDSLIFSTKNLGNSITERTALLSISLKLLHFTKRKKINIASTLYMNLKLRCLLQITLIY